MTDSGGRPVVRLGQRLPAVVGPSESCVLSNCSQGRYELQYFPQQRLTVAVQDGKCVALRLGPRPEEWREDRVRPEE